MSTLTDLVATFKSNLTGISVYSGEMPESAEKPAVVISNIDHNNDRDLEGVKTKRWSVWRITLVDTVQNLQNSIDQILLNDNVTNDYFQRLFVELTQEEDKALTEPYQRAFFDIRVYPK